MQGARLARSEPCFSPASRSAENGMATKRFPPVCMGLSCETSGDSGQIPIPAKHESDVMRECGKQSGPPGKQFLEKTTGERPDLSSVLGTAYTSGRSALSQLLIWIQF